MESLRADEHLRALFHGLVWAVPASVLVGAVELGVVSDAGTFGRGVDLIAEHSVLRNVLPEMMFVVFALSIAAFVSRTRMSKIAWHEAMTLFYTFLSAGASTMLIVTYVFYQANNSLFPAALFYAVIAYSALLFFVPSAVNALKK